MTISRYFNGFITLSVFIFQVKLFNSTGSFSPSEDKRSMASLIFRKKSTNNQAIKTEGAKPNLTTLSLIPYDQPSPLYRRLNIFNLFNFYTKKEKSLVYKKSAASVKKLFDYIVYINVFTLGRVA